MLTVGDSVVYPMHGAAHITGIETIENAGAKKKYYTLQVLCSDMIVSVPFDNAEKLGLRSVVKPAAIKKVAEVLKNEPDIKSIKSISWNRRLKIYLDHLKTGDILEVAKIYKLLCSLDMQKRISVGERRLLHTSEIILKGELMLVKKIDEIAAQIWLKEQLK